MAQGENAGQQGSWLFARCGCGALGVWAAGGLSPAERSSITDSGTWQQAGDAAAWCLVVDALTASHADSDGLIASFDAFVAQCLARQPRFDNSTLALSIFDGGGAELTLSMTGPLHADDRPVPGTPVLPEPSVAIDDGDWRLWSAI